MKFIFCTCNVSVGERITTLLEENEVRDYQLADHVIARSVVGDARLDTPVWPGYNVTITMQFSNDEKAEKIIELLRKFNKESAFNDDELITVCSWNMENYFFD
jgi:hypothetical protein